METRNNNMDFYRFIDFCALLFAISFCLLLGHDRSNVLFLSTFIILLYNPVLSGIDDIKPRVNLKNIRGL